MYGRIHGWMNRPTEEWTGRTDRQTDRQTVMPELRQHPSLIYSAQRLIPMTGVAIEFVLFPDRIYL